MRSHFDDAKTSRAAELSPLANAVQGVAECQPTLHCNSPAALAPKNDTSYLSI